jgi:hypothetical protein
MKISPPHSRLPTEIRDVLDLITDKPVMAFDRLRFYVDHPSPNIPLAQIRRYCNDVQLIACNSPPYQPMLQSRVELFQPNTEALNVISHAIGSRYSVRLTYAEIAVDFMTRTIDDAALISRFMLEHMTAPHLRHRVVHEGQTSYFAPRTMASNKATPHNVVMYADRPSKLWPVAHLEQPCCHLEHRLTGSSALEHYGLFSLSDCIAFDHERFWLENFHLHQLPSKTDIGRWIDPSNCDVSGTALRKRADQFLNRYRHGDTVVLQNCLNEHPEMKPLLRPIDNALFLAG